MVGPLSAPKPAIPESPVTARIRKFDADIKLNNRVFGSHPFKSNSIFSTAHRLAIKSEMPQNFMLSQGGTPNRCHGARRAWSALQGGQHRWVSSGFDDCSPPCIGIDGQSRFAGRGYSRALPSVSRSGLRAGRSRRSWRNGPTSSFRSTPIIRHATCHRPRCGLFWTLFNGSRWRSAGHSCRARLAVRRHKLLTASHQGCNDRQGEARLDSADASAPFARVSGARPSRGSAAPSAAWDRLVHG